MNAVDVLRRASEAGLTVFAKGIDRIVVRGRADAIEVLKPELAAHRSEIVAVLREHGGMTATDAVLTAHRLLRGGLWPKTAPEDCGFFIGHSADAVCKRCGSSWQEHAIQTTAGER